MSLMTEYGPSAEDVGEILVKVQEDLLNLREKIIGQGDRTAKTLDISALENAINKTEQGLRVKSDQVLHQLNNRVHTLPSGDPRVGTNRDGVTMETTYDLRGGKRGAMLESRTPATQGPKVVTLKKATEFIPPGGHDVQGPSPGQFFKQLHQLRGMQNATNPNNRRILHEQYGVQLPIINERKAKIPTQQALKGSTVDQLAVLPSANRVDPQLLPPSITEEDAQKGILSLIERGLIPPAADLTLDPSPVRHRMAVLHHVQDKTTRGGQFGDVAVISGGYKLDPNASLDSPVPKVPREESDLSELKSPSPPAVKMKPQSPDSKSRGSSGAGRHSKLKTPVTVKTLELQPMPPPTTPASAPDYKDKQHRIAIQHGRIRENSQEYQTFKQHYCLSWGSIVSMLRHLERMLTNFAVPLAFINGDKLADLSLEFELEHPPSVYDLLEVIVNRDDVANLITRPGRRFVGPNGRDIAAAKIQATWRMYTTHKRYLEFRKTKWAAGVIAISWIMHVKMSKVRKNMRATRADLLEKFRRRQATFAKNWERIQTGKRLVIHLPSLGYHQKLRETIPDMNVIQNLQMSRLADIKDPNVDVLYISPVTVNDEMQQYYSKLLGLKTAIDSGNVDDQTDLSQRYRILTPESTKSFPAHRMCLATILKYSAATLKRIKNLVRGREAYIVTGIPHQDDIALSEFLDLPVLAPEPDIAHLYSTKSGSKRIFASANVTVPPSEYDIYSLPQLHECLAQLITENLEVTRWLLKLDTEYDGRGIAYLDVADHLSCYGWALKEAQRYGEKWSKKWAQEAAYIKIHAEIPDVLNAHTKPCNLEIYPTLDIFLEAFLSRGGVIEACPPSDSITSVTVDMFIEPSGNIQLVSNGDQIHTDNPFHCWGLSVPQSSVEPDILNGACFKVAEACKARNVIGYFTIDFVTFIHPKSLRQELWAVDLSLCYSDSVSMFKMMEFTTGGRLDTFTHYFDVPPPKKVEKKRQRRKVSPEDETPVNTNRFGVMSTRLHHTNLSVVHYSVFFQMCRAHGIGYDIKEKQGTVFTLVDSFDRENMGMLTVSDNLQGALATFARNLSVIHQEISAPNMQGESNFKPVIEDIEGILGTTIQNADEEAASTTPSSISAN